ncbi:MAG: flagellar basal body P-ring protein FlgI [Hyphomicrobiaceae bacterium]
MISRWILAALVLVVSGDTALAVRIKDITNIKGVRPNQLFGYGLVVGLKGTGDGLRNSPFTSQSIKSMLDRIGVNVRNVNPSTRNVAAVVVTTELPPFVGSGSRIDVTVSSLGDASSLAGGQLVMTPLMGPDKKVYAVAQGSLVVSGFSEQGESQSLTLGVPTTGRIPQGALVEREVVPRPTKSKDITLQLRNPDFRTAVRIADAINRHVAQRGAEQAARVLNARTVRVAWLSAPSPAHFVAEIGELDVEPDTIARVVIDERTGTIVIGSRVRVSTVAVTHGNLTVRVTDTPEVSQPLPFSDGQTVVTAETDVEARQETGNFAIVKGADLHSLVSGLNRMGLKPPGIIAILQAIKSSGALHADLVVQ